MRYFVEELPTMQGQFVIRTVNFGEPIPEGAQILGICDNKSLVLIKVKLAK